ncbi:hypothetical protein ABID47_002690 [Paenibacillus favisporus]|uniref:Uncharacterized protein n=1 Tax=Paenibacillus favisporus TaxID=221028 RepID=A0ABV2F2S5_9BACL
MDVLRGLIMDAAISNDLNMGHRGFGNPESAANWPNSLKNVTQPTSTLHKLFDTTAISHS